jgi:outer membrane protein assembly factor BamD
MTGVLQKSGLAAALLVASLVLSACSGGVAGRSVPLESYTPEELYRLAEIELETGRPRDAAPLFGEVERLYPYSEWAKRALIMQAFAYHHDRDYDAARAAAQRFIDFYPADEDAAYAQYLWRCPSTTRSTTWAVTRA